MSLFLSDRPFGVEIEVNHLWYGRFLPIDSGVVPPYRIPDGLKRAFEESGLPIGNGEDTWRLQEDHSIRGKGAVEVASPHLSGTRGLRDVGKVLRIIKDQGATVDGSCGLHVHHDASDFGCKELVNLLRLMRIWEPLIFKAIPNNERRMEKSCRPLSNWLLKKVRDYAGAGCRDPQSLRELWYSQEENSPGRVRYNETRYHGLNLHSYWFRGTVEFRYMRGTLVGEIAKSWILFTHAIMEVAKGRSNAPEEVLLTRYFEQWRESLKFLEAGYPQPTPH